MVVVKEVMEEETEDEVEEPDEMDKADVEKEVDEPVGTIIVKLYKSIIISNCFYYVSAYSRS